MTEKDPKGPGRDGMPGGCEESKEKKPERKGPAQGGALGGREKETERKPGANAPAQGGALGGREKETEGKPGANASAQGAVPGGFCAAYKPVRIAQIGTGHDHAPFIFGSLRRLSPCFDLVALGLPAGERADGRFGGVEVCDVESLLARGDLEAVAIESTEDKATELALAFARRGVAVHLDKPGTADPAAFHALTATVRERGIPFHTGYMYRYNPAIREAISLARSGALGQVLAVEAHMGLQYGTAKRRWLEQFPGGMTYFLGCHLLDLILQIMGRPSEILPLSAPSHLDGVEAVDMGMVALRYPTGWSFLRTGANEPGGFERRQLVIIGQQGTVEIRPTEKYADAENIQTDGVLTRRLHRDAQDLRVCREEIHSGVVNRYDAMMAHFARQVRGEASEYGVDYEEYLFDTLMEAVGVGAR